MKADLHLCVSPDEAYIPHCVVMLHSVAAHNPEATIHVHWLRAEVFDESLASRFRQELQRWGARLEEHRIADAILQQLPVNRYPAAAWFKIFAPDLIDQPKVLHLDCDLIVRAPLSGLLEFDCNGRWLAAVQDCTIVSFDLKKHQTHVRTLGLEGVGDYFNAGVLLMDLQRMRALGITRQLLIYAKDPKTLKLYPEQDAMNAIAGGAWARLPMKWNVRPNLLRGMQLVEPISNQERIEARFSPAIVHFTGGNKPWYPGTIHPFRREYIVHRNSTSWSEGGYRAMTLPNYFYSYLPIPLRVLGFSAMPALVRGWLRFRSLTAANVRRGILARLPLPVANALRKLRKTLTR